MTKGILTLTRPGAAATAISLVQAERSEVVQLPPEPKPRALPAMSSWIAAALRESHNDDQPLWGDPRPVWKGFTPSALGEPNDRMLIAGYLGYRGEAISEKLQRIFDAGNDIEARWVKRFQRLGVMKSAGDWLPRPSRTDIRMAGKLDIIVEHSFEPGRQILIEVKSINDNGFRALPKPSPDPDVNYRALLGLGGNTGDRCRRYMAQLQIYLYETGMDDGVLLFDNKNTQEFADFSLVSNAHYIEIAYDRLRRLREYWERQEIPPWNGDRGRSVWATYRPQDAVPLAEFRELFEGMAEL